MRGLIVMAGSILTLVAFTGSCASPAPSRRPEVMQAISDLESDSPDARRAAKERILSARDVPHDDIRALAEKYMSGPKKGTAKDAILLLGKLNSTSSIDWLLDHLTFEVFYKETKRPQPPADRFPAVEALIDIGLPAIDPLLARAATEDDPEFHTAAA